MSSWGNELILRFSWEAAPSSGAFKNHLVYVTMYICHCSQFEIPRILGTLCQKPEGRPNIYFLLEITASQDFLFTARAYHSNSMPPWQHSPLRHGLYSYEYQLCATAKLRNNDIGKQRRNSIGQKHWDLAPESGNCRQCGRKSFLLLEVRSHARVSVKGEWMNRNAEKEQILLSLGLQR